MGLQAIKDEELPDYGKINFMGEQLYCDHGGALFWLRKNCLIVSDLHLEKGAAMAARGTLVPPYDTGDTLDRLEKSVAFWKPETIISLGDSFHRHDSANKLPTCYRARLENIVNNCRWIWIAGNHDPHAPTHMGGINLDEFNLGPINFRHQQRRLLSRSAMAGADETNIQGDLFEIHTGEISGHLHPAAIIHRQGKRLRRRCFAADHQRLIMPAFGAYTGGLNVKSQPFHGLFDTPNLCVWMLGRERVYKISGSRLSG